MKGLRSSLRSSVKTSLEKIVIEKSLTFLIGFSFLAYLHAIIFATRLIHTFFTAKGTGITVVVPFSTTGYQFLLQ